VVLDPDGVTRCFVSLTHGQALNAGLTADGSFPRTSINAGSLPSQSVYAPPRDHSLLQRVDAEQGSGRTDPNEL